MYGYKWPRKGRTFYSAAVVCHKNTVPSLCSNFHRLFSQTAAKSLSFPITKQKQTSAYQLDDIHFLSNFKQLEVCRDRERSTVQNLSGSMTRRIEAILKTRRPFPLLGIWYYQRKVMPLFCSRPVHLSLVAKRASERSTHNLPQWGCH